MRSKIKNLYLTNNKKNIKIETDKKIYFITDDDLISALEKYSDQRAELISK